MAERNVNYWDPNDSEFNVEDLCIGVKLEVGVPGRPLSTSVDGTNIKWETVVDDENLFGGTNGYLSTSYSDISSLDAHNGGNKDSFGIEYINIQYNSWNFPEIDMKLIDVRGNSIMNPLESRRDDKTNKKTGSFLNALFTFPYPMFKLTVKGYYGRPVTYKLTVRDVRTNFNASNGNFEVTVKFIGYMFGYLNDIPMQYLLIAPDIAYNNGKTYDLGTFSGGGQIPSFRKFLEEITKALEAVSKNNDIGRLKQNSRKIGDMLSKMGEISDLIYRLNESLSGTRYNGALTINKVNDGTNKISLSWTNTDTDSNGNVIPSGTVVTQIDALYDDMKRIIDSHDKYIVDFEQDEVYRITAIDNFKKDNKDFLTKKENNETISLPLTITFDYTSLESAVKGKIAALNKDKNNTDEQMVSQLSSAYTSSIGWQPTVGNIFEMVLAHFKCFYMNYYSCITNIQSKPGNRKSKDLTVKTDCKVVSDQTVPPYPLLTNSNKKYEWIGNVTNMASKYEENQFVESIVRAATSTGEEFAKIAMEYDLQRNFINFPQRGIPTLLSDIYDINSRSNPYAGTSYYAEDGDIPTAMKVFAKRLFLRYVFNGEENAELPLADFAKLEALNCYREHLNKDEKEYLNSNCWGGLNIVSEIQNYLKDNFTNKLTTQDYKNFPILYDDYKNIEITSAVTEGSLYFKNGSFSEDAAEVASYKDEIFGVYEYLNSQQGVIVSKYDEVFPMEIPLEFTELHDEVIGKEHLPCLPGQGVYEAIPLSNQLPDRGDEVYGQDRCDCFACWREDYKVFNGYPTTLVEQFAMNIGYYSTYKRPDIRNIDTYGICKIPLFLLVFLYKNDSDDLGAIKDLVSGEYINEKYTYYEFKLMEIATYGVEEVYKEEKYEINSNNANYYKLSVLNDKGQKIIKDILSESITFYNLHGTYREWQDSKVHEIVGNDVSVFAKTLNELYGAMSEVENRIATQKQNYASTDKKISIYMTMKELYDRWKFGTWRGNEKVSGGQNLMVGLDNFVFIDSQYDDITYKHYINFDVFADLVRNIIDTSKEMSVYSFLFEICKVANMTLHALPINVYDYLGGDEDKIKEMFTAYPYMACEDNAMQTTYIAMYSHRPSEHLNIVDPNNLYEDDGIDFNSNATVINSTNPLPVFGVTYGLQKQRFFKNISVGSDNPKTTAHSLMSELLISKQATSGSQSLGFEGHDIFDVYASKSYTCKVEMMGNAMIMPMMYFQLNNIPMFKGGYFIISAEHSITKNGMTTTFTGVRVNKNRFDLLPKDVPDIQTYLENAQSGAYGTFKRSEGVAQTDDYKGMRSSYPKESTIIILDAGHDMTTLGKESPKFDVHRINNITINRESQLGIVDKYRYLIITIDSKPYKQYRQYTSGSESYPGIDAVYYVYFYRESTNNNKHPESGNIHVIEYLIKEGKYYGTKITTFDGCSVNNNKYEYFLCLNGKYFFSEDSLQFISIVNPSNEIISLFEWVEENYGNILLQKTIDDLYNESLSKYQSVIYTGDTEENGSLRPLSIIGEEEYISTGGTNNEGRTRYREYWGNRKIVNEIKRQLIANGIDENNIRIVSSQGRNAEDVSNYTAKVNQIYDDANGKCIIVSIHSNADATRSELPSDNKTNIANYWTIYCQNNNEYIQGKGVRSTFTDGGLLHAHDSYYLANCILEEMKKINIKNTFGDGVDGTYKENVRVFTKTEEGIRPLTYCKPPTVLSENFFHTSPAGIRILGSKKGVELIAKAHVDGILSFFNRTTEIINDAKELFNLL